MTSRGTTHHSDGSYRRPSFPTWLTSRRTSAKTRLPNPFSPDMTDPSQIRQCRYEEPSDVVQIDPEAISDVCVRHLAHPGAFTHDDLDLTIID